MVTPTTTPFGVTTHYFGNRWLHREGGGYRIEPNCFLFLVCFDRPFRSIQQPFVGLPMTSTTTEKAISRWRRDRRATHV